MKTEDILNEREKTHGDYMELSVLVANLEKIVAPWFGFLDAPQQLAMRMILVKCARIVCGNPDHADHWDDIAGYAMLGKGKEKPKEEPKEEVSIICSKCNKPTKKDEYGQLSGVCWDCSWGIPKQAEKKKEKDNEPEPKISAWHGCRKCNKYFNEQDMYQTRCLKDGCKEYCSICIKCHKEECNHLGHSAQSLWENIRALPFGVAISGTKCKKEL